MKKAEELSVKIQGMHCAGCAAGIEKDLSRLDGVRRIQVNYATEMAAIDYEPDRVDSQAIFARIAEIGYQPVAADKEADLLPDEPERARRRFLSALLFALPIILLSMLDMFADKPVLSAGFKGILLFILTVPVLFYSGREILLDAWNQSRRFRANMNSLIALGSLAAFLYSVYVVVDLHAIGKLQETHFYFETTASIITLILLGRFLESIAKGKARHGINSLLRLRPEQATVLIDGAESVLETAALKPGMTVLVKPGQKIPADGIIIEGEPSIDESMLTGESVPVDKKAGDSVIGGSINGNNAFRFEVTGSGEDTFLAGIIRLVTQAQNRKAPIQRLADRIAGTFVPFVLLVAIGTLVGWFLVDPQSPLLLTAPVAVLIVACPCAMGLATPTAVLAGTGRAARRGIFIRGGDILEKTVKAGYVIFDKTGTLTEGRFEVVSLRDAESDDDGSERLVQLAASVERGSQHPLAGAIVEKANNDSIELLPVKNLIEYPGFGLRGQVDGGEVLVGNIETMNREQVNISALLESAEAEMSKGRTVVFVAVNGNLLGYLGLADRIKVEAPGVISAIQKSGQEVVVLTGDNHRTAAGVAALLGVGRFESGVKPDQKALMVEGFRRAGNTVVMVGDGINDAPALAAADIGVALGSGTDAAIESADIVLVRDNLEALLEAFTVSRLTYRTIKQNLFWAFFYNILAIPLAAGLFYPLFGWSLSPVIAAGAMAFSSVLVVSNSIRLLKVKTLLFA
ncbi:MAG: copper-translocating P-type ATPase [Candidatus Zixiibacteriota bacterium]|nr:MAG: copper-translocating P-type ATPase [candidate division Zixibacteria bacterium]